MSKLQFRTQLIPESAPFKIHFQDTLMTLGSCFSENIGKRFQQNKFNIAINPFGQQYNPYSIAQGMHRLLSEKAFEIEELFLHQELYHSWMHHSDFSKPTAQEALETMNAQLMESAKQLKSCDYLFLTFGTSHVFALKPAETPLETAGEYIVSNCHKISGTHFNKRYLSPNEIVELLSSAIASLRSVNPNVKIILTVSPVRYLAFGFQENTLSKAHLFTAIHQLVNQLPETYYFPADELVMDDIRAYRYYTEDLLHPNRMATEYVWDALVNCMLDKSIQPTIEQIKAIQAAGSHRPRNSNSVAHQQFITKYLEQIEQLNNRFPSMNFAEERTKLLLHKEQVS
jgi:lysophospholipase L1-like esterase